MEWGGEGEKEGKGRGLSPLYITSGYGPVNQLRAQWYRDKHLACILC